MKDKHLQAIATRGPIPRLLRQACLASATGLCRGLGVIAGLSIVPARSADIGETVPDQIYGYVQILDGKSFEFISQKEVVRLAGFETPEIDQIADSDGVQWPAGLVVKSWMILRTLKRQVNCTPLQRDATGTILAHCFVGDTNLAAAAISEGLGYAYNYPHEPQVAGYFDLERKARGLGLGVWSAQALLPPWQYRREKRDPNKAVRAVSNTTLPVPPPILGPAQLANSKLSKEDQ